MADRDQHAVINAHSLQIRVATQEDLPFLEWNGEFVHYRRLYAEVYKLMIRGEALMWIADLSQDGLIGQAFVSLKSGRVDLADGQKRAYIYSFRVKSAYRGMGVGTRLLSVIEEDLIGRGFEWASLNVAKDNDSAQRLYERLGYHVIGADSDT